jgi:hypothetical protein
MNYFALMQKKRADMRNTFLSVWIIIVTKIKIQNGRYVGYFSIPFSAFGLFFIFVTKIKIQNGRYVGYFSQRFAAAPGVCV